MHILKGLRNILSKEVSDISDLLERDFSVNTRRVAEVSTRSRKKLLSISFTGDNGSQPFHLRSKIAAHYRKNTAAQPARIEIWLFLPPADFLQFKERSIDISQQKLAIDCVFGTGTCVFKETLVLLQ